MTYGQLAAARGTTRQSAERLARRMKWRRQSGNDGFARVLVPLAFLEPSADKSRDQPPDKQGGSPRAVDAIAAFQAALAAVQEAHAGEMAALLGRVTVAESAAEDLRERVDDLNGRLADAQEAVRRAGREIGRTAEVESDLRSELEAAQIALGKAQTDAAELRQAEEVRKGRGFGARLLSAWRGS